MLRLDPLFTGKPNPPLAVRWVAFVLLVGLISFPALDGEASPIEVHQAITESVLREMGWRSANAIGEVIDCNVATDFARLSLVARGTTTIMFPDAGARVPAVSEMAETACFSPRASVGFHFNSLYTFADVETRWREFGAWVDASIEKLRPEGDEPLDVESAMVLLGLITHAVQDFYAHANWTSILNHYTPGEFDPEEFPLWEELVLGESGWRELHPGFPVERAMEHLRVSNTVLSVDDEEGGLQTGSTRWEEFEGPKPWGHRHRHGQERKAIHHLAARATRLWVERVESRLPSLPWRYTPRVIAVAADPFDDAGTR